MREYIKKGFLQGIGLFLGLFATAIFAYTVSGTIKTWTTGDTLTASDLNTTIQSLKTAVESATQLGSMYTSAATGTNYSQIIGQGNYNETVEANAETTMSRAGTVKNAKYTRHSTGCTSISSVILRKNSTDTSISFTIPASTTGTYSNANTVSYVAGDKLAWKLVCSTGAQYYGLALFEF
jgi:hypothetical protein